jgi:acetyltransferase-like isoleucine patch superfamily enzyme
MRNLLLILAIIMPQPIKKFVYKQLGCKIGSKVRIGLSYIDCDETILEDNVKIGHFNIIRRIKYFRVGKGSRIKNFNQFFFSGDKVSSPDWSGKLIIGENVSFMSHHFIDTGGSVEIGNNTIVAGRDTHFWSHSFQPVCDKLKHIRTRIEIGEYVYIGARATILGCSLPDKAIIGAGSVINKSFQSEENCRLVIAGNPATIKKRYEIDKSKIFME